VSDQGVGHRGGGLDRMPVERGAAVAGRRERTDTPTVAPTFAGSGVGVGAEELSGEAFEGLVVDHDVGHDRRAALGGGVVRGGAAEDLGQRIGAALVLGAGQIRHRRGVAVGGAGSVPVGEALHLDERAQDRMQFGALE